MQTREARRVFANDNSLALEETTSGFEHHPFYSQSAGSPWCQGYKYSVKNYAPGAPTELSFAPNPRRLEGLAQERPRVKKQQGRRSSIDINLNQIPEGAIQSKVAIGKPESSRRALSIDGDATNRVSTSHILKARYLDVSKLYDFEEELGRGAFGVVHKCSVRLTGQTFACKTILKSSLTTQLDIEDLKAEAFALTAMANQPSAVELTGIFEDSKSVHLVMEFCEGGDLFDRIKEKKCFSESKAAIIIQKLATVLACAHAKGIMHRDIKPENILLASKDSDTDIRLADFGSAAVFKRGQKLNQLIGSPLYIAPSVLQHSYGTEADMWSLGVVMYILINGIPPFTGHSNLEIFKSINEKQLDLEKGRAARMSTEAKDLIYSLLNRNVEESISAEDVLDHPWIIKHTEVCPEAMPRKAIYGVTSTSMKVEAIALAKAAAKMAEMSKSEQYLPSMPSPSNGRRRSMGMFVINGPEMIATKAAESRGSCMEGERAAPLKSVLMRRATPYKFEESHLGCEDGCSAGRIEEEEDIEDVEGDCVTLEDVRCSMKTNSADAVSLSGSFKSDISVCSSIPIAQCANDMVGVKGLSFGYALKGGKGRIKSLFGGNVGRKELH